MKVIKFQTEEIVPVISMVDSVINTRTPIPVLRCLRVEAKTGENGTYIEFMGSDGEMWLRINGQCSYADEGTVFCVQSYDFLQALSNINGEFVEMQVDEDNAIITCKYSTGDFRLPYESAAEYPMPVPKMIVKSSKKVDLKKLLTVIEKGGFCASSPVSGAEININGMHFEIGQTLSCTSCDYVKIARYTDNTVNTGEECCEFTIPKTAGTVLTKLLSAAPAGYVTVEKADNNVSFGNSSFCLISRLNELHFPKMGAVIAQHMGDKCVTIDKTAFMTALKRCAPMSGKSSSVRLVFSNGNLNLSAKNIEMSKYTNENVQCNYGGEEFAITLNVGTLILFMKNIDTDEARILLKTSQSPAFIKEAVDNSAYDYIMLTTPFKA